MEALGWENEVGEVVAVLMVAIKRREYRGSGQSRIRSLTWSRRELMLRRGRVCLVSFRLRRAREAP